MAIILSNEASEAFSNFADNILSTRGEKRTAEASGNTVSVAAVSAAPAAPAM